VFIIPLLFICSFADAQIKYPQDAINKHDKTEFAYIAQEKLRLEHNAKGKDYRDGIITESQWKAYLENRFNPKQLKISEAILEQRALLKNSKRWTVDLDDLETP
ncbi:MAG: hypothetical protein KAJ18_11855, partial [Candidatus Omnitrophica bacterium]|nr:hypothetical protein [Candidatus Omnitrophota bacterium]